MRKLLKEALEALDDLQYREGSSKFDDLIDRLKTELAKPDPEPVAWALFSKELMPTGAAYAIRRVEIQLAQIESDLDIQDAKIRPLYAEPVDQSARIELLEQRLKAVHAEIEPVAWMIVDKDFNCMGFLPFKEKDTIPVYTTPPDQSARIAELKAALQLAKDMMIANDLSLPRTFEVIDEALAKAKEEL